LLMQKQKAVMARVMEWLDDMLQQVNPFAESYKWMPQMEQNI
jgi:hypothetical protein